MILENSKSAPTFNLNLLCPLFGFLVRFSQSTFRLQACLNHRRLRRLSKVAPLLKVAPSSDAIQLVSSSSKRFTSVCIVELLHCCRHIPQLRCVSSVVQLFIFLSLSSLSVCRPLRHSSVKFRWIPIVYSGNMTRILELELILSQMAQKPMLRG